MSLSWQQLSWEQLSKAQLYQILALRAEVFVVEQECAYQDLDDQDQKATHLLGYQKQQLVAYARVFLEKKPCVIGRVVVAKTHRENGFGRCVMKKCLALIPFNKTAHISAQEHLKEFYESLGFRQSGVGYLEDGIPHIPMQIPPKNAIA